MDFNTELNRLISKSKDVIFLLSEMEERLGPEHKDVYELKRKFERVQDNIKYAKEYYQKGMRDLAEEHINYAKTLIKSIEESIAKAKRKPKPKKTYLTVTIFTVVFIAFSVVYIVTLTHQSVYIHNANYSKAQSPNDYIEDTINTITLTPHKLTFIHKIKIHKKGDVFKYMPDYYVNESYYGYMIFENSGPKQKITSGLIDYFGNIKTDFTYYSNNGRYICDQNYLNCRDIDISVVANKNPYSKMYQLIKLGYEFKYGNLSESTTECDTFVVDEKLDNREEVEQIFGSIKAGELSGEYHAKFCIEPNSRIVKYVEETPSYTLIRPNGLVEEYHYNITYALKNQ